MAKSETGNVRSSHICAEELRFVVVAKICFESLKEVSEVPRIQFLPVSVFFNSRCRWSYWKLWFKRPNILSVCLAIFQN